MTTFDEQAGVILARIEGKLDLVNAALLQANARGDDHETRIRSLEQRPTGITPRVFLTTLVGASAVMGSVTSILANVYAK